MNADERRWAKMVDMATFICRTGFYQAVMFALGAGVQALCAREGFANAWFIFAMEACMFAGVGTALAVRRYWERNQGDSSADGR